MTEGQRRHVAEPPTDDTVAEEDFLTISDKSAELVALSRRAGLRSGELTQLIETLWKESSDASR